MQVLDKVPFGRSQKKWWLCHQSCVVRAGVPCEVMRSPFRLRNHSPGMGSLHGVKRREYNSSCASVCVERQGWCPARKAKGAGSPALDLLGSSGLRLTPDPAALGSAPRQGAPGSTRTPWAQTLVPTRPACLPDCPEDGPCRVLGSPSGFLSCPGGPAGIWPWPATQGAAPACCTRGGGQGAIGTAGRGGGSSGAGVWHSRGCCLPS